MKSANHPTPGHAAPDGATSPPHFALESALDHPLAAYVGLPVGGALLGAALHAVHLAIHRLFSLGQIRGQRDQHRPHPGRSLALGAGSGRAARSVITWPDCDDASRPIGGRGAAILERRSLGGPQTPLGDWGAHGLGDSPPDAIYHRRWSRPSTGRGASRRCGGARRRSVGRAPRKRH